MANFARSPAVVGIARARVLDRPSRRRALAQTVGLANSSDVRSVGGERDKLDRVDLDPAQADPVRHEMLPAWISGSA